MSAPQQLAPWVLVCGGFHRQGGMDRANLSLAEALLQRGHKVYLVAHQIDSSLAAHRNLEAIVVPRPLDSVLLGERALRRAGLKTADTLKRRWPETRVVVNGGNCEWPDINWVHSVHSAWPRFDQNAPLWFRVKSALNKWKAVRDEKRAIHGASLVVANSERTRRELVSMGVNSEKIRTIYLGSDPSWIPSSPELKLGARRQFGIPEDSLVVCFVGALGYDRNKGFETLLQAWEKLRQSDVYLLAAGGGRGIDRWKAQVQRSGSSDRIRLLGFTDNVGDVYTASDVLVSPVRYEAYGLNVHEAICRGVPSIVSADAGVAEIYPETLRRFLLRNPTDGNELAAALNLTLQCLDSARTMFSPFAERLRARTWSQVAQEIIALAEQQQGPHAG